MTITVELDLSPAVQRALDKSGLSPADFVMGTLEQAIAASSRPSTLPSLDEMTHEQLDELLASSYQQVLDGNTLTLEESAQRLHDRLTAWRASE